MDFVKAHHLGNDFIFVKEEISDDLVIKLCDRKNGIGADGVVVVNEDLKKINIINNDGSHADMCGNALMCIGKLYPDWKYVYIGNKIIYITHYNGSIDITMGIPSFLDYFPKSFKDYRIYNVEIGNYHMITIIDNIENFDLEKYAKEYQKIYKCNVSIIGNITTNSFKIRTYELGANETNACGSGITSSFYVLRRLNLINNEAICYTKTGSVSLFEDKVIHLIGNPTIVFKGEYL